MGKLVTAAGLALGLLTAGLQAQASLTVNPSTLTAGGTATISYADPSKAGETVVVQIDNGGYPSLVVDEVLIDLDANGNGSATWHVPSDWWSATFQAPDAPSVNCAVVRPDPPPAPVDSPPKPVVE